MSKLINYFFSSVLLLIGNISIHAMEYYYKITINNQLDDKLYLNVKNPNTLTDSSPYFYIKPRDDKILLLHKTELNQSIAFPGGYPTNKVELAISHKKGTSFTIKRDENRSKILVIENSPNVSNKILAEIWIASNPQ